MSTLEHPTDVIVTSGVLLIVPTEAVVPNPTNPRRDARADTEMIASIRAHGLIHPLVVREIDDADGAARAYELLAGHRRLDGCIAAELDEVPVIVRDDVDDEEAIQIMLVENLTRAELAPLEEAAGYRALADLGLTQRQIADKVGVSQGQISKRVGLLKLPESARDAIDSGRITIEQAHSLAKVPAAEVDRLMRNPRCDTYQIERAVREAQIAEKVAAARARLTEAGVRLLDGSPDWHPRPGGVAVNLSYRTLERLDPAEHATMPCHAVWVENYSGREVPGCTDWDSHAPADPDLDDEDDDGDDDGDDDRKERVAARRAEYEKAEAERILAVRAASIARERRLAHLHDICRELRPNLAMLTSIVGLATATLPYMVETTDLVTLEKLGVDTADIDYDLVPAAYREYAQAHANNPARLLLAMCAHFAEAQISATLPDDDEILIVRAWLEWLEDHGYDLDDTERDLADRRTTVEAETAEAEEEPPAPASTIPVPDVTIGTAGRGSRARWTVTCDACGTVASRQTTEEFAGVARASHLLDVHHHVETRLA